MLVDERVYTGSLNIAQRYTTRKYGCRAFRDLSVISDNTNAKYNTKEFFLNAIMSNRVFHDHLDTEKIQSDFDKAG